MNRVHTFHIPLRNQLILLYMKMKLLAGKSSPSKGKQDKIPHLLCVLSLGILGVPEVNTSFVEATASPLPSEANGTSPGPPHFLLMSYFFSEITPYYILIYLLNNNP